MGRIASHPLLVEVLPIVYNRKALATKVTAWSKKGKNSEFLGRTNGQIDLESTWEALEMELEMENPWEQVDSTSIKACV